MKHKIHMASRQLPADLQTPVGIYLKLRDLHPVSALLESSDYHTTQNAVSIIGICPMAWFTVDNAGTVTARYPDGSTTVQKLGSDSDNGMSLPDCLHRFIDDFDFDGDRRPSLMGYTAYDAVRYFEPTVPMRERESGFEAVADMQYVLYRHTVRINHYKSTMTVTTLTADSEEKDPEPTLESVISLIANHNVAQYGFEVTGEATSDITDADYLAMVDRGIAAARRGDVFQIVLSRRFSQPYRGDDFNVYRALRSVNPSPYLFYFDFGSYRVMGSSPETHLRVQGHTAYIDPIAGTFRRTGDDVRDHELADALLVDAKENAEHIMLVDLARNDLARGGAQVSIEFLRQIQYYSHVIHMVSRVKGQLPEGADTLQLFAGTFPAGTLSGAPKVKAMQLISDIEPHCRLTYGGCIGLIGFDGSLNQAITIRSFLSLNGVLYSQAGAGIVARSVPASELQEVNNKLGALRQALNAATNLC